MKRFILYILCWMGWFVLSAGNDYSRFFCITCRLICHSFSYPIYLGTGFH